MPNRGSKRSINKTADEIQRVRELTLKWRRAAQVAMEEWMEKLNERGAGLDLAMIMARSGIEPQTLRYNEKRKQFKKR